MKNYIMYSLEKRLLLHLQIKENLKELNTIKYKYKILKRTIKNNSEYIHNLEKVHKKYHDLLKKYYRLLAVFKVAKHMNMLDDDGSYSLTKEELNKLKSIVSFMKDEIL